MSVKLILDQNLSPKLIKRLSDLYPDSAHLEAEGLGTSDDLGVWDHAVRNGFVIVTKDADFADLSVMRGFPPRVIWIRRGNCSTSDIEGLLREHNVEIEALAAESDSGILTLF